ncbi:MAG TPA: alpha/beta hydrolase [Solirubrobacterales bacterium]|nr:alpha/beta hydrolase [Solirubrobacterales bacterium]
MPASDFEHVFQPGEGAWTLLLLHGTGGDQNDLVPLGRQLAPGANLLSPRGKVLENGVSPRFFRRLAIGQLDIPDLIERTDELAAWVGEAAAEYSLDPGRIVALGLSNGANIAVSLLFRHPELLAGAGLLRPMLPYDPPEGLDLSGRPVLIAAGGRDPYVPASESVSLGKVLEAGGAEVTTHLNPEAGHGLTEGDLVETSRWITALLA